MNNQLVLYPDVLQSEVVKSKKYIPRKLCHKEHMKIYHKYYNQEYGIFKVQEIYYEKSTEYYHINFGKEMNAVIQYPSYNNNKTYELLYNYDNIEDKSIINNQLKSFTGAEIKFWFTVNKVNFLHENYRGFFNDLKNNKLYDTKKYHIRRNKKLNIYQFIEDESSRD